MRGLIIHLTFHKRIRSTSVNGENVSNSWNQHCNELESNGTDNNTNEHVVVEHAFKDVYLVSQTPRVELVEDLHENEKVVNNSVPVDLS